MHGRALDTQIGHIVHKGEDMWQRWATNKQEARASAKKALEQEYPTETCEIVSIEATGQTYTRR